jgi:hypothetical protein
MTEGSGESGASWQAYLPAVVAGAVALGGAYYLVAGRGDEPDDSNSSSLSAAGWKTGLEGSGVQRTRRNPLRLFARAFMQ